MNSFSGSAETTRFLGTEQTRAFGTAAKSAILLFAIAFSFRVLVFLLATTIHHIPLEAFAMKGDGASYLASARAILGDSSSLTDYDRRVFPGYPALIALFHLIGLSFPLAALLIDWLCSGLAAAFALLIFPDRRVAWAMLFLLPHYLGNSTLAMSEAPLLAFTLAGLLLVVNERPLAGGILFALAAFIRPMACFVTASVLLAFLLDRRFRQVFTIAAAAFIVLLLGTLAIHYFTGDALRGFRIYRDSPRAYTGQIFELPFHALLTIPTREHVAPGFTTYIYIHVLVVLTGCAMIAHRVFFSPLSQHASGASAPTLLKLQISNLKFPIPTLNRIALLWLLTNTAFQLCIGSTWGFRHFTRFAIPSQPALFWALCPLLPKAKWPWLCASCGILILAVVSVQLTP